MVELNLYSAWIGILVGMIAGAVQGLFFHGDDWLGGYGSWRRRLMRLGHISFFGIAFVNLAFVYTADRIVVAGDPIVTPIVWASYLFIAGAVLMPLVCYLSAWIKGFRHAFFLPVCSLIGAVFCVMGGLLQ